MSHREFSLSTVDLFVGHELGVSAWMLVDKPRIDGFARCTGDHQWIHVDAERAKRESPFGTTIAHGYLTLATLATSAFEVYLGPGGIAQVVNYGLDRVRFIAPVKSGARIRTRIKLLAADRKDGGRFLLTTENTVEIEGSSKPALVAHALVMVAA